MNNFFKKNKIIIISFLISSLITFIFSLILVFLKLTCTNKNISKNNLEKDILKIKKPEEIKEIQKNENKKIDIRPKFYFILDDVGYNNDKVLEEFKKLNLLINFSIIPYLPNSMNSYNSLVKSNKIVMIHFPMQSKYRKSIEKFNISINNSENDISSKIQKVFDDYPEAKIMNNHMGSLITSNKPIMKIIFKALKEKNRYFFDSVTTKDTVSLKIANEFGFKIQTRDVFLDSTDTKKSVLFALENAKKIARKFKNVKVIGHIWSKNTLKTLKEQEKALNKEFEFKNLISLYEDEN